MGQFQLKQASKTRMIICPIFLRCVQYSARNTKIIADSIGSLPFDSAVCLDWVGITLSLFLSPLTPVAVNSKGLWVGCPIVRAKDVHWASPQPSDFYLFPIWP
jgi:hypothetical protein